MRQESSLVRRHFLSGTGGIMAFMLIILSFAAFTGCAKKEEKAIREKVVNVRTASVETRSLKPFIESVATLKPFEEVIVSAQVDGILNRLHVKEGSVVSKGMLLAEIDDTDYKLEKSRADAALRQANASLANTRLEFDRKEALFREALISRQQYDDIVTRRLVAEGDVDRARGALELAAERSAKTRINAPISAAVRERRATPGDYVRNGTPLLVLTLNNPVKLIFSIPEKDVPRLKIGQECIFKVEAFPGHEFKAQLSVIYPNLEERTRTLQAEALAPNSQLLLKPGMFARVAVNTDKATERVVVPITSLLYENNQVKAFVVEDDKARGRLVRLGAKYGEYMEIVEGLKGGEQLVVVGQNNLAEGVKVNVAR